MQGRLPMADFITTELVPQGQGFDIDTLLPAEIEMEVERISYCDRPPVNGRVDGKRLAACK